MKLTGKLKEKVSKAETKEQAKELIANAGMELTDEEMAHVFGGCGIVEYAMIQGWVWPGAPPAPGALGIPPSSIETLKPEIQNLYKYKDLTES